MKAGSLNNSGNHLPVQPFSLPRITGVTTNEEALELLESTQFDLVIIMAGQDRESPVQLSDQIKQKRPDLLIYLLLNQKSNIGHFEELIPTISSINKLFVWTGDSQIFFAMVKSIEDQVNVENDTKIGLVRIILLIEDSAQYYSKYLPIL
jgi:CheY-like chemotaxis protein